jgi:cytochrome c oxidase subunit 3
VAETAHAHAPEHAHAPGHAHHPDLAHHFEDLAQQRSSATLGMWAFLGTEVMFFGGLIGSYVVYRFTSPDVFGVASKYGLNVWLGSINTVILLTSSLFMAFAVHGGATGDRKAQVKFLWLTLAFGLTFMVIKGFEYREEWHEGLVPGPHFSTHSLDEHLPHEPAPPGASPGHARESASTMRTASFLTSTPTLFVRQRAQLFFVFYFFMTGLHLIHMVIGIGLVLWVLAQARHGRFTPEYHVPLEMVGLYWHFIDIVWVFLFPLLYLVALHK